MQQINIGWVENKWLVFPFYLITINDLEYVTIFYIKSLVLLNNEFETLIGREISIYFFFRVPNRFNSIKLKPMWFGMINLTTHS